MRSDVPLGWRDPRGRVVSSVAFGLLVLSAAAAAWTYFSVLPGLLGSPGLLGLLAAAVLTFVISVLLCQPEGSLFDSGIVTWSELVMVRRRLPGRLLWGLSVAYLLGVCTVLLGVLQYDAAPRHAQQALAGGSLAIASAALALGLVGRLPPSVRDPLWRRRRPRGTRV